MGSNLFVQFDLVTERSGVEVFDRHFPVATHEPELDRLSSWQFVEGFDVLGEGRQSLSCQFAFGDFLDVGPGVKPDVSGFMSSDAKWRNLDHEVSAEIVASTFAPVLADSDIDLALIGYCEWIPLAIKTAEFIVVPRWDLSAFGADHHDARHGLPPTIEIYAPAMRRALENHELSVIEVAMPVRDGRCDAAAFAESIGRPGRRLRR